MNRVESRLGQSDLAVPTGKLALDQNVERTKDTYDEDGKPTKFSNT